MDIQNVCDFSRYGDAVATPDLIEIQTKSYARFLQAEQSQEVDPVLVEGDDACTSKRLHLVHPSAQTTDQLLAAELVLLQERHQRCFRVS